MENQKINLNKQLISVTALPFGLTTFEAKMGRAFYIIEINKKALEFNLEFYKKLNKTRTNYSKFEAAANLQWVNGLRNSLVLNKYFFKNELTRLEAFQGLKSCKDYFQEFQEQ